MVYFIFRRALELRKKAAEAHSNQEFFKNVDKESTPKAFFFLIPALMKLFSAGNFEGIEYLSDRQQHVAMGNAYAKTDLKCGYTK